jgi:hypothetical protein
VLARSLHHFCAKQGSFDPSYLLSPNLIYTGFSSEWSLFSSVDGVAKKGPPPCLCDDVIETVLAIKFVDVLRPKSSTTLFSET